MVFWRTLISKLSSLFHRRESDQQIDDELRFHLEHETAKHMAAGLPEHEARRRALLEFGGMEQMKEDVRDADRFILIESAGQDTRFALRMLRKNPAFTVVAILTLALGIGANAAIFEVVNAVLLQKLPFRNPDRVVAVQEATPGNPGWVISPPNFEDYRRQQQSFEALSMWMAQSVNLTGLDRPERITGSFVSSNFFEVLGVPAAQGRLFLPGEDRPEAPRVVVLSDSFWKKRFGGDPTVIGRQIRLNGEPKIVVGILPANYSFPLGETDAYLSIRDYPNFKDERGAKAQLVIGRIKDSVSLRKAAADLDVVAQRLAKDYPQDNAGIHVELTPVQEMQVGSIRPALLILLGAVGLVLLIACANLANLLLARGAGRMREIAVRAALGASRMRIVRQLMSESLIVSLIGGSAGLLIAWWGVATLLKLNPSALPVDPPTAFNPRVALFAAAVSIVSGLIFGTVPALQLSKASLAGSLAGGGRTTSSVRHRWMRSSLVVAQVALSVVLLIGAGLLVRSFQTLLKVDPGFRTQNLLTMEYRLPKNIYSTPEKQWDFHQRMLREVQQVPGVTSAAIVQALPFSGNGGLVPAWPAESSPEKGKEPTAQTNLVTSEYFATIGLPVLMGRNFDEHDTIDAPTAVVINKTLAMKYWPGQDPIGKELRFAGQLVSAGGSLKITRATVIGVVPDTKHYSLRNQLGPQVYFAYSQATGIFGTLVVKTAADPINLSEAVRAAVWRVDKDQPVWKVRTLETLIQNDVAPDRLVMVLMSLFGVLALILTLVGTYGVISFGVAQRTQEIGVRMALGATPHNILSLVLNGGLLLIGIGCVLGVGIALAATRAIRDLLYQISPLDPTTFLGVLAALAAIALLATYVPARRATRVDPMVALRYE